MSRDCLALLSCVCIKYQSKIFGVYTHENKRARVFMLLFSSTYDIRYRYSRGMAYTAPCQDPNSPNELKLIGAGRSRVPRLQLRLIVHSWFLYYECYTKRAEMLVLYNFLAVISSVVAMPSAYRTMVVHESRQMAPVGFTLTRAAPSNTTLNIRIFLKQSNLEGLKAVLMNISSPSNANYGQHLSKEEVEAYITPSVETTQAVTDWLSSYNVSYTIASPAGDSLSIYLPVSKASDLFNTKFNVFTHQETGSETIRTLEYSVPVTLKDKIDFAYPTTSFPNYRHKGPVFKTADVSADRGIKSEVIQGRTISSSCASSITPICLQELYGIPTKAANSTTNQLVVTGYDGEIVNRGSLKTFLETYRPDMSSSTSFTNVVIDLGSELQLDIDIEPDGTTEADLDIEYTVGLATGVPITFLSVGGNYQDGELDGYLDTVNYLLNMTAPYQVITTSYTANEDSISLALANKLCDAYVQLGARGTSIIFSSGDGGVAGTDSGSCSSFVVTFPTGCPYMTSVGAVTGIDPEIAAYYSSGGFSNYFATPSYQSSVVSTYLSYLGATNLGKYNASGRGYPDVSVQGSNFEIADAGTTYTIDGTSCSTPVFASIIALLNDELITAGKSSLGFLNPWLYENPAMFNDVTSGDNPGCDTEGFSATTGWDPVTGLGTPNYPLMRAAAGLS